MIEVSDLEFAYDPRGFRLSIDRFSVASGQQAALIGPSGSGKSTLLHLLAGILAPQAGSIRVDGRQIDRLSRRAGNDFRIAQIGLVFQTFELLEYLTVRDNILLPFRITASMQLTPDVRSRARQLANELEIFDKLDRFPGQLSQGEQQRVAIARALVTQPKLLLADEPTGNLDPRSKIQVLDLMLRQAAQRSVTLVMVTHDYGLLDRFETTFDISNYYCDAPTEPSPKGASE